MLGGSNIGNLKGHSVKCFYLISSTRLNEIVCFDAVPNAYQVFTLESFLEKFPYKMGDKVKHGGEVKEVNGMKWDTDRDTVIYTITGKYDIIDCYNCMFMHPYKEEIPEKIKIDIPKGYEFTGVDNQQVVFEKISFQYPKNFKECCEVLGCKANDFFTNFSYDGCDVEISDCEDKVDDLLQNFRKLIYCRNAYWKLAGEEMGFIPWRPSKDDNVYCIFRLQGEIVKDNFTFGDSLLLEFPTEEMRDAFFENFGHLIEICKELL